MLQAVLDTVTGCWMFFLFSLFFLGVLVLSWVCSDRCDSVAVVGSAFVVCNRVFVVVDFSHCVARDE